MRTETSEAPAYDREHLHDGLGRRRGLRAKGLDPDTGHPCVSTYVDTETLKSFDTKTPKETRDPFWGL